MSLSGATNFVVITPSIAPTADFRVEIDCTLTSALSSGASIDLIMNFGSVNDTASDANQARFVFANENGIYTLRGYAFPYTVSAAFGPLSGATGAYMLAFERVGTTLKLEVNGVTQMSLTGTPPDLAVTPYINFSMQQPSLQHYLTISAFRLTSVGAIILPAFWTSFIGAGETI